MSETMVERLAKKRLAQTAVVAKFERIRVRVPAAIFLALEALPDQAVYQEAARDALHADNVIPILCDGKSGVLEFLEYVRSKYGSCRDVIFFVDRDLDDFMDAAPTADDFLYVTPGYSIENELATVDAFKRIVTDVLLLDPEDELATDIIKKYEAAVEEFATKCLPLMAWVVAIRRLGGMVNLNNAVMRQIFICNNLDAPLRAPNALEIFARQCATNVSLCKTCFLRPIIRELKNSPAHEIVRGKYLLWFLLHFVDRVKLELKARKTKGERRRFLDATIDENNLFQLLSGKLKRPKSLIEFFERIAERRGLDPSATTAGG